MRPVLFALLFMGVACGGVAASPGERWQSPDGSFSVDLAGSGWRLVERSEQPRWYQDGRLFVAIPVGQDTGEDLCMADIHSQRAVAIAPTREALNDYTRSRREWLDAQARADERVTRREVRVAEVDGVATLDEETEFMSLETIVRRFFVARDQSITMYELTCMVRASNPDTVQTSRTLAASLRFQ